MMKQLYIRSVCIDWGQVERASYLWSIPALKSLSQLAFHRQVTFFAGENGSGKSTLLEALAVSSGFNAEGGTKNYHFSTYDDVSSLADAVRLVRGPIMPRAGYFFRAESFFNVATTIVKEYDDGTMPDYHKVSHGESFLEFLSGSERRGLYLMDEPEAALSPQRQLSLLIYIARMAAAGSQFIIATHSPILLGIPDAEILSFDDHMPHPISYEEAESVKITRLFLDHRHQVLHALFQDSE